MERNASGVARPIRLAALAAEPVFYQAPLYRRLAADPRVDLTVLFASAGGVRPYDAGFGAGAVAWDVDLLEGYRAEFLASAETNNVLGGFLALRDPSVVRRLRELRYDVLWVHGYSYLTHWLALAAAAAARKPVLLREEQTLLHDRPLPKRWVREAVLRTLFARVHALHIGSRNRAFFDFYGVRESRSFFVPYAVDNGRLRAEARELASRRDELRRSFGIGPQAGPVVLFVGKLIEKKRPLLALEAFARVRRERPCALLVVGTGPLEAEVRRRAADVPDVYFAGFLNRSAIARAYAAADVFVLPSALNETWGLVVNEAMNFSLPVVVSDKVGCAADLVRTGENGHVVPADDAEALAGALRALVADEGLRAAYGRRSLELIDAWSYDVAAAGVIRACEAAVGRGGGG